MTSGDLPFSGSPLLDGGGEPERRYRPMGDESRAERADRLAVAARTLAAAEGRAPAPAGPVGHPSTRHGLAEDLAEGTERHGLPNLAGSRAAPLPDDPQAQDDEPDPESVARAIVLRQLSMAPRSRQQLADKLRRRGCADEVSTRVLDRMESVGLVDDEAFAEIVVRSKQATKGLAKRALAHELRGKGVADETISEALGSIDPESERGLAEEVAAKAMRRLGGLDPQVQARRLAGVLGRKGYPPSVVYAVVRDAVNEAPEHQRD